MEVKRCAYCGKKLSSRRRADARYCPTSRCRVGGYRQRVLSGSLSTATYAPYETRNMSRGDKVIERWMIQELNIIKDPWCQARADRLAYEIMAERCAKKEREAQSREFKESMPFDYEETVIGPWRRIRIAADVRCVGVAIIPTECGGGAVVVTAKAPSYRYGGR